MGGEFPGRLFSTLRISAAFAVYFSRSYIYPMDLKKRRDSKRANPREHSKLCDRDECSQQRGNLKDDGYIESGEKQEINLLNKEESMSSRDQLAERRGKMKKIASFIH
ncbi:hypothetical protein [Photorhabdus noenieputensis]|uniref:hypothetical protein n=1 Tax=Photorhabdus noenieputensis TaxID=1208607 RepID=UPI001BD4C638|nr:hypothetical protein [Photorhabdus noenieputensis]MCK3668917.1 hypothetical protein [Photorhabdus noenieputensis]